jgi:hypothetical protein
MTPRHLPQQVNDRSIESFRELGIAPYFDDAARALKECFVKTKKETNRKSEW